MTFKSIQDERESLKVKIHTLECIRDAKEKPLEYWLVAASECLKEIYSEEPYKGDFRNEERLKLESKVGEARKLMKEEEKLKEEAEKLKEEAEKLKEEVEKLKEEEEKLNALGQTDQEKIKQQKEKQKEQEKKLKEEEEKRKELKEKRKEIEDVRTKAQDLITKELEKYRCELEVKDAILLKEPAELEDKISHIFDRHFFTSKFFYIQVFILLAVISFAGFGTWQLFSGAKRAGDMVVEMETKVINASTRIDTITAKANTEIDKLEKRLTETATDKIPDIEEKVVKNLTGQVKPYIRTRIDKVFETRPAEQWVDAVIDKRVTTIAERNEENINKLNLQPLRQKLDIKTKQMQSLEDKIDDLEERVQEASKGIKFSVFGIWDYMDWFLKTSLILFYLLLLSLLVFRAVKVMPLIKRIMRKIFG